MVIEVGNYISVRAKANNLSAHGMHLYEFVNFSLSSIVHTATSACSLYLNTMYKVFANDAESRETSHLRSFVKRKSSRKLLNLQ